MIKEGGGPKAANMHRGRALTGSVEKVVSSQDLSPTSASPPAADGIVLLVSGDCVPCVEAAQVWGAACAELDLPLRCLDVDDPAGRALVEGLRVMSVPLLLIDGTPAVAGVPEMALARQVLAGRHTRG